MSRLPKFSRFRNTASQAPPPDRDPAPAESIVNLGFDVADEPRLRLLIRRYDELAADPQLPVPLRRYAIVAIHEIEHELAQRSPFGMAS
jgi:hypothetical protein